MSYHERVREPLVVCESTSIAAPPSTVWWALTDADALARWYYPGVVIASSYAVGEPITWDFDLEGRARRDHGTIRACEAPRRLVYDHWSAISRRADDDEGRTLITIDLEGRGEGTALRVRHERFAADVEFFHARFFWRTALPGLKSMLEAAAR